MTYEQAAWLAIVLDITMIGWTLWILARAGLGNRILLLLGGGATVWLLTLRLLLVNETAFPDRISGPAFLAVIFVFVGIVGVTLFAPRHLRIWLLSTNHTPLMLSQAIRVLFGAVFLLWALQGVLPRTFGLIDGITHITAGLLGLAAALTGGGARPASRSLLWIANAFGLADILIVASSIALVLLPDIGPHHPMMYAVFLPAPVWLWFHLVSLRRLLRPPLPRVATSATASVAP